MPTAFFDDLLLASPRIFFFCYKSFVAGPRRNRLYANCNRDYKSLRYYDDYEKTYTLSGHAPYIGSKTSASVIQYSAAPTCITNWSDMASPKNLVPGDFILNKNTLYKRMKFADN